NSGVSVLDQHRHRAQRAGVSLTSRIKLAIENDAASGKIADEKIEEVFMVAASAESQLRAAGGCRVIRNRNGQTAERFELGLKIAVAPGFERRVGRADLAAPIPQLERHGHAKTGDALLLLAA